MPFPARYATSSCELVPQSSAMKSPGLPTSRARSMALSERPYPSSERRGTTKVGSSPKRLRTETRRAVLLTPSTS